VRLFACYFIESEARVHLVKRGILCHL